MLYGNPSGYVTLGNERGVPGGREEEGRAVNTVRPVYLFLHENFQQITCTREIFF